MVKIIALLPFKNEEALLPTYISGVAGCVDKIIALDDGSTDSSRMILEKSGVKVYNSDNPGKSIDRNCSRMRGRKEAAWDEISNRQKLLDLGRKAGGTHFLCLDADEIITKPFSSNLRDICKDMSPGQYINSDWLNVCPSLAQYYHNSPWPRQDVLCADLPRYNFTTHKDVHKWVGNAGMHVDRVHVPKGSGNRISFTVVPSGKIILHFQWAFWHNAVLKQAWYRVSELSISGPRKLKEIRDRYYNPDVYNPQIHNWRDIPEEWVEGIVMPTTPTSEIIRKDLMPSIMNQFDNMRIEYFEKLDIWHIKELREEFVKRTGREPKG